MILGKFQHEQVAEAGLQASDMFEHSFHMGSLAWNCRQNQKRMRMSRKTMIWQPFQYDMLAQHYHKLYLRRSQVFQPDMLAQSQRKRYS